MEPVMGKIKVALRTLGCRANQYDTELMRERLRGGFEVVAPEEEADIYIINTCTVTARAEAKARQYIHGYARRGLVLVTGCWATVAPEEVAEIEGVGMVFNNAAKLQVRQLVREALAGRRGIVDPELNGLPLDRERIGRDSAHTRAFVKIQDGCDRFCTFCRTVFARGRPRSKSPQAVIAEVGELVKNGFSEVVLTGINLAKYGKDNGASLAGLLWALAEIPGLKRIRLSSIDQEGITPELMEFFRRNEKACPYFHIPLQSGDDLILKRMNRGYTADEYRERIELIKENVPKATFGADVLVGFPGEGEEEFARTYQMIEEVGFLRLHVFRYSPRPRTAAANFPDQVPERIKLERARWLRELGERLSRRVKQGYLGQQLRVLVEERAADGHWRGWSENYIDVHIADPEKELRPGKLVEVEILELTGDHLLGSLVRSLAKGQGLSAKS
jgi:threonylcarbamoyladenosine tRNA methylthiotransferase MtaB